MNYIYDIILNFNEQIYDFYEWNKNDILTHIRKIPLLRINSKDLYNIENNNVKFTDELFNKINNKTEIFSGRTVKNIDACLFSDGTSVLALKFKNNKYYYSKLIIEEEMEIIEVSTRMKEITIDYKIISEKIKSFKTRKELEIENYVKKELNILEKNNEVEKLEYLFFECFGRKDYDIQKLYSESDKIYSILKLIQINNV